jgi:Holliday junction DNA helicase RuvA
MIAYLSGKVIAKTDRSLILNVNNVGYLVNVPTPLLEKAELHLPLELHIHTNVREDELSLYGFESNKDLQLFQLLISVNGVGPRLGMDLLKTPIDNIKKAIMSEDTAMLTQMKGIGKKTAERIVLELKDKIAPLGFNAEGVEVIPQTNAVPEDVLHALLGLGYHRKDITRVFRSIKDPMKNSEDLIKYFLKHI